MFNMFGSAIRFAGNAMLSRTPLATLVTTTKAWAASLMAKAKQTWTAFWSTGKEALNSITTYALSLADGLLIRLHKKVYDNRDELLIWVLVGAVAVQVVYGLMKDVGMLPVVLPVARFLFGCSLAFLRCILRLFSLDDIEVA